LVTVLITGGTGLVGQMLNNKLSDKGYIVRILTRTQKKENDFSWDIANNFIDEKAFENLDYIIHLAGAGIAEKRWTPKRKEEIITSRTKSTELVFNKIQELKVPLRGFISASAVGYYGAKTTDKIFTETDLPANDFLGNVCQLWEKSVLEFDEIEIPTTIFRLGIVLSKKGGALEKMKTPIITPIANGKQYIPWIDINDLTNMFIFAIENNVTGIFNAVAPEQQTSYSFSRLLAKKTKRLFVPIGVPTFLLKLIFGKMSIILTTGSRVSSDKINNTGFQFIHKKLESSLNNLT
tara:strand:- start:5532 stop:6410 length:879 start_codon:yes stop_codon:yes gene_type:complete